MLFEYFSPLRPFPEIFLVVSRRRFERELFARRSIRGMRENRTGDRGYMYIYIFVYVFLVYFCRRKIFEGKYLAHLRRIESWPRYRLGRATLRSILARGVSATPCRTVRETSTPRKGKSVSRIRGKTDILLNAITSDLIFYPVLLLLNRTSPLVYLLLLYLVVDLSKTRANNGRIV